jgi:hypothetical protein
MSDRPGERKRWGRVTAGTDVAPWHASFRVLLAIAVAETDAAVRQVMDTHKFNRALREFRDHIYKNKMKPDRPGGPGYGDRTGIWDGRLKADMDRLTDALRTNPLWPALRPGPGEDQQSWLYSIREQILEVLREGTYYYRR